MGRRPKLHLLLSLPHGTPQVHLEVAGNRVVSRVSMLLLVVRVLATVLISGHGPPSNVL